MIIELAIATNENYLPGAIATLASARIYTPIRHSINVICLHDGLTSNKQEYLIKILKALPGEINVNFLELDVSKFADFPKFWADGASLLNYSRLLLCSLLPPNVQKILYLDVDLFVKCDLSQLYSIDINGYEIAACVDKITSTISHDYPDPKLNFDVNKYAAYFNSGVLLIDIASARKSNSFKAILNSLEVCSNQSFKFHDQSALNYYYQGDFLKLDQNWNIQLHFEAYSQSQQIHMLDRSYHGIFHFVTKSKPWNSFSYHPLFIQYIRFLDKVAPSWESSITFYKESGLKKYQKKLTLFMILRSLLIFIVSASDERKMCTLLYWIKLHQQKKIFAKLPIP